MRILKLFVYFYGTASRNLTFTGLFLREATKYTLTEIKNSLDKISALGIHEKREL
jgi:hypothetical protein